MTVNDIVKFAFGQKAEFLAMDQDNVHYSIGSVTRTVSKREVYDVAMKMYHIMRAAFNGGEGK